MGFVIFESSGTFTPGNYGLTYGDVITVVAVGGGGSSTVAGGASSFGSLLTAPGGLAAGAGDYGGDGGWCFGSPYSFSRSGNITEAGSYPLSCGLSYQNVVPYFGGVGEYGTFTSSASYTANTSSATGTAGSFQGIGAGGATATTNGNLSASTTAIVNAGGGGAGYGAGGGGGYACSNYRGTTHSALKLGGGAGQLKQNSFVVGKDLTSSIAVTVGAGGAANVYKVTNSSNSAYYAQITPGAGAAGCVAIFW